MYYILRRIVVGDSVSTCIGLMLTLKARLTMHLIIHSIIDSWLNRNVNWYLIFNLTESAKAKELNVYWNHVSVCIREKISKNAETIFWNWTLLCTYKSTFQNWSTPQVCNVSPEGCNLDYPSRSSWGVPASGAVGSSRVMHLFVRTSGVAIVCQAGLFPSSHERICE